MKWIKLSERLPDSFQNCISRYIATRISVDISIAPRSHFELIEWLDETEPHDVSNVDVKEEEDFENEIAKHSYDHTDDLDETGIPYPEANYRQIIDTLTVYRIFSEWQKTTIPK